MIYLDQNYVSSLTKVRLGRSSEVFPEYAALWEVLREGVQRNLIVCPIGPNHRTEFGLAEVDYERELYKTMSEVWCGVELRGFPATLMAEVRRVVKTMCAGQTEDAHWSDAYLSDPHAPCQSVQLEVPSARFESWTTSVREYHERRGDDAPTGSFQKVKKEEAELNIVWLYEAPMRDFMRGDNSIFTLAGLDFVTDLRKQYESVTRTKLTTEELRRIIYSREISNAPFLDIHSTLRAVMRTSSFERPAKGSDLQDVLTISSVLPYVDVMTTDRFMKGLAVQGNLSGEYDVTIFSAAKSDVRQFTEAVEQTISNGG